MQNCLTVTFILPIARQNSSVDPQIRHAHGLAICAPLARSRTHIHALCFTPSEYVHGDLLFVRDSLTRSSPVADEGGFFKHLPYPSGSSGSLFVTADDSVVYTFMAWPCSIIVTDELLTVIHRPSRPFISAIQKCSHTCKISLKIAGGMCKGSVYEWLLWACNAN